MLLTATRTAFAVMLAGTSCFLVGTQSALAFQDASVLVPDAATTTIPEPALPNGTYDAMQLPQASQHYFPQAVDPSQYGLPNSSRYLTRTNVAPGYGDMIDGSANIGVGSYPPYGAPGGYMGRVGSPYYYSTNGFGAYPVSYGGPQYMMPYGGYPAYGGSFGLYGGYGPGALYARHFGPGFYRNAEYGHYRFPYYSYRRPWYHPGPPSYHRDTNLAW